MLASKRVMSRDAALALDLDSRIKLEEQITDAKASKIPVPAIPDNWTFSDYSEEYPWRSYEFNFLGPLAGKSIIDIVRDDLKSLQRVDMSQSDAKKVSDWVDLLHETSGQVAPIAAQCTRATADELGVSAAGQGNLGEVTPLTMNRAGAFDLKRSFAYADSHADRRLLAMVGHPVATNPDADLRRFAKSRNWMIEDFTESMKQGSAEEVYGRV